MAPTTACGSPVAAKLPRLLRGGDGVVHNDQNFENINFGQRHAIGVGRGSQHFFFFFTVCINVLYRILVRGRNMTP